MTEKEYPYKVSVSIITYNQVDYIEKAIDSAIVQEVNFPYEIIIGDDGSTDGTRAVLLHYKERYPDLIKLHLHDEHYDGIPGRLNNVTNIRSARGKYIAFLDGDDYWISTDKLQRQADFMDTHPSYAFCAHNMWEIKKGDFHKPVSAKFSSLRDDDTFTLADIASKRFHLPSVSLFLRMQYLEDLPGWFWDIYTADLAIQFIAIQHGPAKYFSDIFAGYRIHESNISKTYFQGKNHLEILQSDEAIYNEQFPVTKEKFLDCRSEYFLIQSTSYFNERSFFKAFISVAKSITYDVRALGYAYEKIKSRMRQQFISYDPPVFS